MAVVSEKYTDRPLIGKVLEVNGSKFTIGWYVGTYSGIWKTWKGRVQGKTTNFTDEIEVTDVVFRNIEFTKAMRLPPATSLALRSAYSV